MHASPSQWVGDRNNIYVRPCVRHSSPKSKGASSAPGFGSPAAVTLAIAVDSLGPLSVPPLPFALSATDCEW